jgi:Zn-dependent protease with chaperone function
MTIGALALVDLPVAVWGALGVALVVAYRRSHASTVFRLTALFLGVWAVLATTALVFVLENGGWSAVVALSSSPGRFLATASWKVWLAGGIGAFFVFLSAFILSQTVGRGFLRLYPSREVPWPSALPSPSVPVSLRSFRSIGGGAFAFTLLERAGPHGVRSRDVIMISESLLSQLSAGEWEAVVAHELGHLRELDGRYLTFFRTLSRLMRWDPILAFFAESLTHREEYRADLDAVELTHRPRTLARALFKAASLSPSAAGSLPGLLGVGGRRGQRHAMERIRRLVALAESGEFPEDVGG